MKRIFMALFVLLIAGCSSPGKPAFYYDWTQYRTGVNVLLVNEPQFKYGYNAILRSQDDGEYAMMALYDGGIVSHFGYVTKDNVDEWIAMYAGFLKWEPDDKTQKTKFTINDGVSLFPSSYEVEYSVKNGRKLFLMNHSSSGFWFRDFSKQAVDENNVTKLLKIYVALKSELK
ncbi:hypothetical protein MUA03_17375 [Enterobacteriaceae bacterium H16N7]|nr:hypothetical protein [Dryocola clanedunensis]